VLTLTETERNLIRLFNEWRECEIYFNGEYKEYEKFYQSLKFGDKKSLRFIKHVVTSKLRNSIDHYHNHQHSIMVMILADRLYNLYFEGKRSYELICAAICHDALHSLGAETDDKNIQAACSVVDEFFIKKSEKAFCEKIKELIKVTQYPYSHKVPDTLEKICLREADLLYALHSNSEVSNKILNRLNFEFTGRKIVTSQDCDAARKSQYDFFLNVEFNTELGKAVHKKWLHDRSRSFI
jgi:hypothetical protein